MIEEEYAEKDIYIHIDNEDKIVSMYGNVTKEQIAVLKKYKPKYTISVFISGKLPFGSNMEELILQNV
jgi:hypothetical protein